jgi:N-acetylmuramoyl-L-alanine amidase
MGLVSGGGPMYRRAIIIALIMIIIIGHLPAMARGGNAPVIKVIYPHKDQTVSAADSTFILGNVTPGSKLHINKYRIPVHPGGGFIAFLPIEPGDFIFNLKAENKYGKTKLEWPVTIPEPYKTVPPDSFAILDDYMYPGIYQELGAGDLLEMSFRGTPGYKAGFMIPGLTDWREMFERSQNIRVLGSETVFGSENQQDTVLGSGIYRASLYIPADSIVDSALIIYRLCRPAVDNPADTTQFECLVDTAKGKLSVRRYEYPQVVEMIDSIQTIRTGPRKGYLSIFQPKGVRFITDGKYNNYVRLRLAPGQPAWVPDSSVEFLPPGTPVPYSEIAYIRTFKLEQITRVAVYLNQKLPFRVEEDPDRKEISLLVYYATSNTDWIRYDTQDDLVKYITWSQTQEGIYRLVIKLDCKQIWGYDAYYEGNVLCLDIKKPPHEDLHLKHLKIVIDPGHSSDPGAVGPTGLTEAEANLKISKALAKILRKKGAEVVMTRTGDEHVELNDRPKIAVREDCDLFISVHNNALPDGVNPFESSGVSTYYYHLHSKPLAEAIQKRMSDELEIGDYGHYYANFAVTRPTQYPAVLVECTFMILPEEEIKLRGEDFPEECAEAIADGIEDFLKELK